MTTTFKRPTTVIPLTDVEPAAHPLKESSYRDVLEARLTSFGRSQAGGTPTRVEACSNFVGNLIHGVDCHPLVTALHLAYAEHRPVRLSPDMIWLLICQGVAQHVRGILANPTTRTHS